ncbi:uncharacterized protein BT62DRAFT_497492 [Guyanagaster necrorhizus]|uniref:Uncharacterized protein n=1 Tax=Guyanagaster necrorhizus TaxID=856835 RepID=A0A9P7W1A4_9AGAR|nr:uncharacterized protein BT62DRAFT_497492 [Guyanagaster necrorhizus MCA 3950]KAG7450210.1 hypothetical protein BT62DRAFT_497492 [Guyanagaster necrorhizus MCA 3950]
MLKEHFRSKSPEREKEKRHRQRDEGSQRRHSLDKTPNIDHGMRGRERYSKDISERYRNSSPSNRAEREHRLRSRSSESYSSFSSKDRSLSKGRRCSSRSRSPRRRKDNDSRRHKYNNYIKDRKRGKGKEKDRKKDKDKEGRRSVLTGKKVSSLLSPVPSYLTVVSQIKLKVKKDKGDDEREANRKDLLQFLNSTFE